MEFSVIPMSALRKRDQWKVEYFVAGAATFSSTAYKMVRLGDVLDERRESLDPTEFLDHRFNYLGLENVEGHTGDLIGFTPCLGSAVKSRSKIFREGDVLYGRLRPYLNKVFYVGAWLGSGICSGEFIVLQTNQDRLEAEFCRYLLASSLVQERVAGLQVGSTHPRLNVSDLFDIQVPLPTIDGQRKMLGIIRKVESQRKQAKANAASMTEQLSTAFINALRTGNDLSVPNQLPVIEVNFHNELPAPYLEPKRRRRPV